MSAIRRRQQPNNPNAFSNTNLLRSTSATSLSQDAGKLAVQHPPNLLRPAQESNPNQKNQYHQILTTQITHTEPQDLPHEAEARTSPEAEPTHPAVDPPEDGQHNQVLQTSKPPCPSLPLSTHILALEGTKENVLCCNWGRIFEDEESKRLANWGQTQIQREAKALEEDEDRHLNDQQ